MYVSPQTPLTVRASAHSVSALTDVDESSLPIKGESAYTTRERECAPNSRFRRVREGVEPMYEPSHGPAFINSHVAAMDYCENPEYMQLHGKALSSRSP